MAMKGKKPTYDERKFLIKNNLDTNAWLVQKSTPSFMQIIHRETKEERVLNK